MQKHSAYVLRQFAGTEHRVQVFTAGDRHANMEDYHAKILGNTDSQNIRFEIIPFPSIPAFPGHYVLASWLFSRRVYKQLKKSLSDCDVIYAKGFTSWYLGMRKRRDFPPLVIQMHGLEMYQRPWGIKDRITKLLLRFPANIVIRNADYILSYGGKIKDILLLKGKNERQIFEQYGAVDHFWQEPRPAKKSYSQIRTFLFVARYEFRKGYHILKPAIEKLLLENKNFRLQIVGEIPEEFRIQNAQVAYYGNRKAEEIKDLCDMADVLLLPSLAEGFPTILVETMARGVIPLATDVGAVQAVVNSENGWLISEGNVEALYEAMCVAIETDQTELQSKSDAAVEFVHQKFNWNSMHKTLVSHLQTIVHDHRKRTDSR